MKREGVIKARSSKERERANAILKRLKRTYTIRGPFVEWKNPLELLIATVLSAQCTDVRVNQVTKQLFKQYKTAQDYAKGSLSELEARIHSTGFYKAKARYLKGIGQALVKNFNGKVPEKLEELLTLPGVARKSAYLILAKAFHHPTGIAVDTHVSRVAPRLGFTKAKTPEKIARDLEKLYEPKNFLAVNEYCILHGRAICKPRMPLCLNCCVKDWCPSFKIFYPKG
ncbi:MAG: endonuclease III [Candidatus Kerfeldbacteria bacterium RIFCSPHIGHO2_02_FULL_42_14]|uniref:Endonuclease III n=1 Tax=Candidatus Kerfeldbacteria bacterium RIFCSPHIGHO2_02_FULL_42_14 TaxID=1798540 RepID=A0A1G2AS57_9BACT|nr:MAG: endonuclease III [Candidatus Kerfeldbacteria bacterium RIFCSPHIGHO2_02_FULL_42_14]OGY82230.1 MAG: endonuclease III [Candidatus Kerfeldbacteria bacterium RIFCSPHIGHO2_12_FULL_42_13]OGY82705.1 MAG: endonuclease III [Candidatus Kerfeldbacteria bacterium RIFCSPLOWO2_02_FULL_42_19]OGY87803.1 MAG: endonuclease III [Candidatus Kerfeldbacteria bacterium RIFCSPLOWO2_12_FULL_43_9]